MATGADFYDSTFFVTTKQWTEGIAADYDSDGKLAGIEILDAIKRFVAWTSVKTSTFKWMKKL